MLYIFFLYVLSAVALVFEVPTALYLWGRDTSVQTIVTSTWVTYHVGDSNNGMSIMYIFVLLYIALPRLMVLYLPKLRVLTLYAALLQLCSAAAHCSLLSHIWIPSGYDYGYMGVLTALGLLMGVRFFSLLSEVESSNSLLLEKRAAELTRIRAMRAAYQETKRREAEAANQSKNNADSTSATSKEEEKSTEKQKETEEKKMNEK